MGFHQMAMALTVLFFRALKFLFFDVWPIGLGLVAASLITGQSAGNYSDLGWLVFFVCLAAGLILRYSHRHQADFRFWKDYHKLVIQKRFLRKKEARKNAAQ